MLNQELIQKEFGFLGDVIYMDVSKVSLPPMRVQNAWKEYIDGYVKEYCLNYDTYYQENLDMAKRELAK